jgi:sugar lactone lactonase YvrE
MKPILIAGTAVALLAATGFAIAQQAQTRPYYVGNPLGLPAAPPAPDAAQTEFAPISDNVKMYGALYSVESCSYDPVRDVIVAPARGVGQNVRANDAYVVLVNHDGSINTPRWIGYANAGTQRDTMDPPLVLNEPFGSDIMNGILYMADRDGGLRTFVWNGDTITTGPNTPTTAAIAMFDMATGAPVGRFAIDAPAFNDIEVREDGVIFASVSGNNGQIWRVEPDGTASVFIDTGAPGLNSPNGVAFDNDGNLVVVMINDDGVVTYDINTGEMLLTEHAAQAGSDGLVIMPDGTKYVSSVRNGGISMIRPGEPAVLIAENISSAASMCYDAGANQLVVPMNANNGLAFIKLD